MAISELLKLEQTGKDDDADVCPLSAPRFLQEG
jgi:hypothetical protein